MEKQEAKAHVKVITFASKIEILEREISNEIAGQKAMGLLKIPCRWRLPFFVVDKLIYQRYCELAEVEKKNFLLDLQEAILSLKDILGIEDIESKIIVRSSGTLEGMYERGKFDSKSVMMNAAGSIFEELYTSIQKNQEVAAEGIPFIVQPYLNNRKLGHLSNEIRFSKDRRDWRVEEIIDDEVNDYNIAVRKWRLNIKIEELVNIDLIYDGKSEFKEKLRSIAHYCYEKFSSRAHLELIWDKDKIYIAQIDFEIDDNSGWDPIEYDIRVTNSKNLSSLTVLREVTEEDAKKFHKVENVFVYKNVGLKTAPLYILDNLEIIKSIASGYIPDELKNDFCNMLPNSIVIRSDVAAKEKQERQLLPRSNELRNMEEIEKWLIEKSSDLLEKYQEFAFLLHIFIPARAAAFACAGPNNRIVDIQSLWGLPEGLYYNSHDRFIVDTKSRYAKYAKIEESVIKKRILDFKSTYIAPDENGKWTSKIIKKSSSWKQSIANEQILRIAVDSRKIAQQTGKDVSIMWFVGIDETYYGIDCLPWHHEEYDKTSSYSYGIYKKKYNTEEELVVKTREDLQKLTESNNIKIIQISPNEDSILREKNFLADVAEIANQKNLTVFLKGSVLAHPLYQLLRQNVKIVMAKEKKPYIDNIQYNKLVRDKIPSIIQENLEDLRYGRAMGEVLVRACLEKLIEELYEVFDASSEEDLYKEFADVEEICFGLEKGIKEISQINSVFFRNKLAKTGERELLVEITNKCPHNTFNLSKACLEAGGSYVEAAWNREALDIEVELKFSDKDEESANIPKSENSLLDFKIINRMLLLGFQIQKERDVKKILAAIKRIRRDLLNLEKIAGVSKEKIDAIQEGKREKNGGFEKGFILLQAGFLKDSPSKGKDDALIKLDCEPEETEFIIKNLEYKGSAYTDYREGDNPEFLVRVNFPLSVQKWEYVFEGEKVQKYFGDRYSLIVSCERDEKGMLKLSIYRSKREEGKQLVLD